MILLCVILFSVNWSSRFDGSKCNLCSARYICLCKMIFKLGLVHVLFASTLMQSKLFYLVMHFTEDILQEYNLCSAKCNHGYCYRRVHKVLITSASLPMKGNWCFLVLCCAVAMSMKELMEGFVGICVRRPSTVSQSQSLTVSSFSCAPELEV